MPHPVWRGLALRCPACGVGRLSAPWWAFTRLHDTCVSCGIPFIPGRGEFTGGVEIAVYVSTLLGLIGAMTLLLLRVPAWVSFAWVIGFGALFPLATYRHAKGIWVGAMYAAQPWARDGDPPHVAPIAMPRLPWDDA